MYGNNNTYVYALYICQIHHQHGMPGPDISGKNSLNINPVQKQPSTSWI